MMDVRVMWLGMSQPRVSVPMGMRFARRIAWRVLVLVVLVVVVEMFAFQRLMDVLVFVSLGDVQPDADEHENARGTERPIEAALSDCESERGACKRGRNRAAVRIRVRNTQIDESMFHMFHAFQHECQSFLLAANCSQFGGLTNDSDAKIVGDVKTARRSQTDK